MCTIPLATLAISAVSTVAETVGQQRQAEAAAAAQNAYNRQQERNALIARNANLANLEVERNFAAQDVRAEVTQNTLAARRAMSTARVSAGEAGVAGLSVDALLRDLAGQAGYDNTTAYENYLRHDRDINARRENYQISYESGLNSIRQPQIQGADYLGAALRIGQSGLKAYTDYQDRRERRESRLRAPQNW